MQKTLQRLNCPKCLRPNSVRRIAKDGAIIEHCFGAGCQYYQKESDSLDMGLYNSTVEKVKVDTSSFLEARSIPAAFNLLSKYGCLSIYNPVWYDVKQDRVVFQDGDLYVGRAISPTIQPKWYVYSDITHPFTARNSLHRRTGGVVLVEDCISAGAVSNVIDSIALLGTTIRDTYLETILQYEKIYIALDEDATTKALKIYDILSLVKDCTIIPLRKDLKYYSINELHETFKYV